MPRLPCATADVESISYAGYVWSAERNRWVAPPGATKGKIGLKLVGAAPYWEHETADILTLSYILPCKPPQRWVPGMPPPADLLAWLAAGNRIEFHNAMFEKLGWHHVLVRKYGWPPLNHDQVDCSMATAHVNGYPGALADLGAALGTDIRKDPEGARLMDIFSKPRNPTKPDPRTRIYPHDDPVNFERYQQYCDTDCLTEEDAADRMEPMTPAEREAWLRDQAINWRGMAIDRPAVRDCIAVLEQALDRYGDECREITGLSISQGQAILGWIAGRGVRGITSFDAKKSPIEDQLKRTDLPDDVRRVLEIRALIGSAGVKKLYAMEHRTSNDDRLRNMFVHHGARTGRPTGEGVQTTNLVKIGPKLVVCGQRKDGSIEPGHCGKPHLPSVPLCPWCGTLGTPGRDGKWKPEYVDHVLEIMSFRSLEMVERFFGDAVLCIQGCIRGLLVAGPGMVLIASDYVAIEAVVAAAISGEQWRIDVFRRRDDIYLTSASKITGTTMEEYRAYKETHGEAHPHRQKVGKIAELALGFGGWTGSWRAFDPDQESKSDQELTDIILAWRAASPKIVEMWGGQRRKDPVTGHWRDELYGIEGAMVRAIQRPGTRWDVGPLAFYMTAPFGTYDRLKMRLPSGRELTYHHPKLRQSEKRHGTLAISYFTDNSNVKYGSTGWVQMDTWGSRIFENAVQGIAHDLQRFAMGNHEAAGYPIVQHVYDENCSEVPLGYGSVEEYEQIMMRIPDWAYLDDGSPWPVRADGGWTNRRYRKA